MKFSEAAYTEAVKLTYGPFFNYQGTLWLRGANVSRIKGPDPGRNGPTHLYLSDGTIHPSPHPLDVVLYALTACLDAERALAPGE